MNHSKMLLVLAYLSESGSAKSGEVAEGIESLRGSRKYVSLILTRCHRRGLVSRRPYKCGRERGYIYELSDKGAEWLLYKAFHKKDTVYDGELLVEVPERRVGSPKPVISNSAAQGRLEERYVFNRVVFEVLPVIMFCNVVSGGSNDPEILNWTRWMKQYWQIEYENLKPHLPLYVAIGVDSMLSQSATHTKRMKTSDVVSLLMVKRKREEAELLAHALFAD